MKTIAWTRPVLLLALLAFTPGCNTRAKFQDVSAQSDYAAYIGRKYVLNVPMHLSGVNLPPGLRKVIDVYTVNPASPGWTGPELVTRDTLPPGTVLVVDSVQRCTNCFLDFKDRLEAQVRIENYRPTINCPIQIALEYLEAEFASRR